MKTSSDGLAVLKHYEGCELTAYPDPATNGDPWTIGYGCTGADIKRGLTITMDNANERLYKKLSQEFEPGVLSVLKQPIEQGQFDACVCLAFNIGMGNFRSSTLAKRFNAGDMKGAADQFLRWNRAAGKVMLGLRRRRASERALFLGMTGDQAIAIGQSVQ